MDENAKLALMLVGGSLFVGFLMLLVTAWREEAEAAEVKYNDLVNARLRQIGEGGLTPRHPVRTETYKAAREARLAPYRGEQEMDEAYDPRKSFGRN